jgi:hypothetical protein
LVILAKEKTKRKGGKNIGKWWNNNNTNSHKLQTAQTQTNPNWKIIYIVKGKGIFLFRRVRSVNHTHGAAQPDDPKKVKKQKKKYRKTKCLKRVEKRWSDWHPETKRTSAASLPLYRKPTNLFCFPVVCRSKQVLVSLSFTVKYLYTTQQQQPNKEI